MSLALELPQYLERLQRQEEHRGTRESLSRQLQSAGFQVVTVPMLYLEAEKLA
jgi:hypothetical protein